MIIFDIYRSPILNIHGALLVGSSECHLPHDPRLPRDPRSPQNEHPNHRYSESNDDTIRPPDQGVQIGEENHDSEEVGELQLLLSRDA